MVTTTVLRPRRAPSSASTAAVVVLPTPARAAAHDDAALGDEVGEAPASSGDAAASTRPAGGQSLREPRQGLDLGQHRPGQLVELGRADVGA